MGDLYSNKWKIFHELGEIKTLKNKIKINIIKILGFRAAIAVTKFVWWV